MSEDKDVTKEMLRIDGNACLARFSHLELSREHSFLPPPLHRHIYLLRFLEPDVMRGRGEARMLNLDVALVK